MNTNNSQFSEYDQELFEKKSSHESSNSSWALSFADIVTVLLCFFMIFYIIEKKHKNKIKFDISKIAIQNYKKTKVTNKMQRFIETIKLLPKIEIINKNQFLEVNFPPEIFYRSGSTKLTKKGMKIINTMIQPLLDVKNQYHLQIQGFSDSTKIKHSKNRWWNDNMQLSLERSLQVYYLLIKKGVQKNILSVTGFGQNKPLSNEKIDLQRRISFKFEPVLKDEK